MTTTVRRFCTVPIVACLASACAPALAEDQGRFRDPQDGWLDASRFLDTHYGFLPVVAPITEPAVGYGATGALVFIDRHPPVAGQPPTRPNIAVLGGFATENGSEGLFAGHLGSWQGGRLQTEVAMMDSDVNLEFFGLGEAPDAARNGLDYRISATGGVAGGKYRLGDTHFWAGLRYALARTEVKFEEPGFELPGVSPQDRDLRLAALTPSLVYDTRDNFFTPTRGWRADLTVPIFRSWLGGDRDFEKVNLTAIWYRPLAESVFFAIRATGKASSDGTPFYMRPYVMLRGVPAMQYQGEQAAESEVELRWQFHPRFSLVGFGGAGIARSDLSGEDDDRSVGAGGAGFRYLIARTYGLHMGIDVAFGPEDPAIYVIFGSAWSRP
jgi:hypothetical protein